MQLVPERLRGETAKFDIKGAEGEVLVEKAVVLPHVTSASWSNWTLKRWKCRQNTWSEKY